MSLTELRYTLLQTVNEVLRKTGLNEVSTVAANKLTKQLVDHINDTVSDLSDYGNWQEMLTSANVTVQSSVNNYFVNTSAVIKNIGDVFITNRIGPLLAVPVDQMRIMTRATSYGIPTQYSVFGVDANGNPNLRVRPTPVSANLPATFSINYYVKPPMYTTTDDAVVIPFPARVVVNGTLARYILNESEGAPTDMYKMYFEQYIEGRRESLNRYNFDTGHTISFNPGQAGRARRWR
jgi:hypothetical protein